MVKLVIMALANLVKIPKFVLQLFQRLLHPLLKHLQCLKLKPTFSLLVVSFVDDPKLARLPLNCPLISSMSVLISVIAASVLA